MVRSQFLISRKGIYFNTGTVGASPRTVLDAVVKHMTAFETVFDAEGVDYRGRCAARSVRCSARRRRRWPSPATRRSP